MSSKPFSQSTSAQSMSTYEYSSILHSALDIIYEAVLQVLYYEALSLCDVHEILNLPPPKGLKKELFLKTLLCGNSWLTPRVIEDLVVEPREVYVPAEAYYRMEIFLPKLLELQIGCRERLQAELGRKNKRLVLLQARSAVRTALRTLKKGVEEFCHHRALDFHSSRQIAEELDILFPWVRGDHYVHAGVLVRFLHNISLAGP